MERPAVSVLTPTYNRAHILHRVYDSLERQSVKDFEWIVVDDGSTDDTPALVARWQAEADFPITFYRYSNNRGQTATLNTGRMLVSGEYAFRLDSDDALLDDAMEMIAHWRSATGADAKPDICGLAFRCVDEAGGLVGKARGSESLPEVVLQATNREARYRYGMTFDFVRVMKTERFQEQGFDELTNSENAPPVIYWNRFSDRYETIFVDRPIRRYYRNDGEARLSDKASRTAVKWPRGNYLRALTILNEDVDWLRHNPKVFLNAARKITRLGLHIGRSPGRQFRDLAHTRARMLWAVGAPGGFVGYIRDRLHGRCAPKADPDISAWGPAAPPEDPVLRPPPDRFGRVD
ncbi:MAG: glycosyltransferase family A protein [Bryobacterales bacterium]|nr:glycosyltransferase family A protein [Bryobacterales bacterium]